MSLNDPLANVLSFIQLYERKGKREILTKNNNKLIKKVLTILQDKGYIGSYEEIADAKGSPLRINLIGNINKVGVIKPRFKVTLNDFTKYEKRYLPAKDFGIIILTTNKGLMTHIEAKEKKIGGRLVSYCY
ncbi:MAG TPA: 30S ribosomal protein S8 [Candidatus Nanoarchaeia archaeon]|nr:30S ribosomal protein S8 [Candidatus Nanoarchaeia archaeon]